jgi:3',5'-cyclic AMP phosphodiesterase CpdA
LRLFFASDLHVDVAGNAEFVRELAAVAAADRPDVVVIAGDVCNGTERLEPTLRLFADAAKARIYVPGNHELWAQTEGEPQARERYFQELPRIARAAGFHALVREPLVVEDVGFVGTMGWYDYSFADPADGYSRAELESKSRDGLQWMDARFVRWTGKGGRPLSDPEVADLLLEDLRDQIEALAETPLRTMVLVTHHLAFRGLVPPVFVDGHLRFFRAFLGSERFGEAARAEPRIALAFAGHVHSVRSSQEGPVLARTCPTGYPRERTPGVTAADRRLLIEL